MKVVPLLGTWIEMPFVESSCEGSENVVPLLGTWIEIVLNLLAQANFSIVVPLLGTWIEIRMAKVGKWILAKSFPYWERGLKLEYCRV